MNGIIEIASEPFLRADLGSRARRLTRVNTHFWEMFSSALMLSVISAGVQISQGGDTASSGGLNAQQSIAAGLGQQFGQLGQELAQRNARIQPTLEIRPGYRFTISVTKDMVPSALGATSEGSWQR